MSAGIDRHELDIQTLPTKNALQLTRAPALADELTLLPPRPAAEEFNGLAESEMAKDQLGNSSTKGFSFHPTFSNVLLARGKWLSGQSTIWSTHPLTS